MAVKKTLIFLAVVFLIAFYIGSRGVLNRAAAASIPQPAPSATPLPNRAVMTPSAQPFRQQPTRIKTRYLVLNYLTPRFKVFTTPRMVLWRYYVLFLSIIRQVK